MVADPPDESTLQQLVAAARAARVRAHAPYSRFAVGAALLDAQGRIHAGCNVENAAYPEGLCAEAVALGALVMARGTRIVAAAVVGDAPQPVTPCGGCRQKLREFARGDAVVLAANEHSELARYTLAELLPASFGPDHLQAEAGERGARRAVPEPARIPSGDRPPDPADEGSS